MRSLHIARPACRAALLVLLITSLGCAAAGAGVNDPAPAAADYGRWTGRVAHTSIVLRKSQVMNFADAYESALVADVEVADVVPLSDHSLYVLGKKLGSTRLVLTDADKEVVQIVEVTVTHDLEALRAQLDANLDAREVEVSTVNEGILLSGIVASAIDLERALMIAEQFAPKLVSNALSVRGPQQVMLEVRFVEASRSASRELGISTRTRGEHVAADTGPQGVLTAAGELIAPALLSGAQPFGSVLARLFDKGLDVDVLIRALERRSLARRLAEPNLITTSGDTANFLAGGEFPFPVSAGSDQIAIQFKPFGVSLSFTPTVLADGQINLKIEPEVSEIDPTTSVEVAGTVVPGLVVRRARTTVELNDGQSLAIAGLLQNNNIKNHSQLPWIGSVPVLGALFRSAEFQNRETDLVIIVTPRLVHPKLPDGRLATPLDSHLAGNDVDFFAFGRTEVQRTGREGDLVPEAELGHFIRLTGEAADVTVH